MTFEKETRCINAREICEHMERNGGGKVNPNVYRLAIQEGWVPLPGNVVHL